MKKRARAKKPTKTKAAKTTPKPAAKTAKAYTPTPIQGIGWAPFRYPLS